jgi:hypothetical protein
MTLALPKRVIYEPVLDPEGRFAIARRTMHSQQRCQCGRLVEMWEAVCEHDSCGRRYSWTGLPLEDAARPLAGGDI